eukprot:scaffold73317_cov32-Tisochrysis_lutea.AAC.3
MEYPLADEYTINDKPHLDPVMVSDITQELEKNSHQRKKQPDTETPQTAKQEADPPPATRYPNRQRGRILPSPPQRLVRGRTSIPRHPYDR